MGRTVHMFQSINFERFDQESLLQPRIIHVFKKHSLKRLTILILLIILLIIFLYQRDSINHTLIFLRVMNLKLAK